MHDPLRESPEGREEILGQMRMAARIFAAGTVYIPDGVPFHQFKGLINEYIQYCEMSERRECATTRMNSVNLWVYNSRGFTLELNYLQEKLATLFNVSLATMNENERDDLQFAAEYLRRSGRLVGAAALDRLLATAPSSVSVSDP